MIGKIFLKEWKENILIFSLSILLLCALVALNFSDQKNLILYFSGMLLWLFLPFSALLIGSGGFHSEFKDNAWIYLFSRPIKKEKIWIIKYISLLSIVLSIFLIFYLLVIFFPKIKDVSYELGFSITLERGVSGYFLYLMISILALTISFSISFLSEKQFILVFISILMGTGLVYLFRKYIEFLWINSFFIIGYKELSLLIGLSFIAASILTFVKSDFSQRRKKIIQFTKYLIIFLILSFFLNTVWVTQGKVFSGNKNLYSYLSYKQGGDVFLGSYRQGILRYHSNRDRLEKVGRESKYFGWEFSLGEGKIVFLKTPRERKRGHYDLWIMNTDGSGKEALIEPSRKESPFFNLHLRSFILSPDGKSVAFITEQVAKKDAAPTLWWMYTDGTGLKSTSMDIPNCRDFRLIAWPESSRSLILLIEEQISKQKSNVKVMMFSLQDGMYQSLAENVIAPHRASVSPNHEFMALGYENRLENNRVFAVIDLKSHRKKEIYKADFLGLWRTRWNKDGNALAFFRKGELWMYSISKNISTKIIALPDKMGLNFDWMLNDNKLVVSNSIDEELCLIILGEKFKEEKRLKLPDSMRSLWYLWGLDNVVLVKKSRRGGLWRVNIVTGEWKKVY